MPGVFGFERYGIEDSRLVHRYYNERAKSAAGDREALVDVEKARAVSVAYFSHYGQDTFKVRGVEVPFTLPIVDPATRKPSGLKYGGIIDAILEDANGDLWFCDHKTASRVDQSYWEELKLNPQLSLYLLAARQVGLAVRGFVWDVVQKPTVSPKQLTKASLKEIETDGTYCGLPVGTVETKPGEGDDPDTLLVNGEAVVYGDKETPRLYGLRVFQSYVTEPEKHFVRRKVYRRDEDLYEFACELHAIAETVKASRGKANPLLRNYTACKSYGSLCEFHQACCGEAEIDDPAAYMERPGKPADRAGPAKGALSISQIGTFLQCPRRWQYRYDQGRTKAGSRYESSLEIGGMVHKAIEIVFEGRVVDPIALPNR